MKAWIMSICGVAFLGVMIDIISPEGKMNKFVKSIFSIIFLFVLVQPVINLVKTAKFGIATNNEIVIDYQLLDVINEQKCSALAEQVVAKLIDEGYANYGVEIKGNLNNNKIIVSKVIISCPSYVLYDNYENINISENITNIVSNFLNVDKEVIVFE